MVDAATIARTAPTVRECRTGGLNALIALNPLFFLQKQCKVIDALLDNFVHLTFQGETGSAYPPPVSRAQ